MPTRKKKAAHVAHRASPLGETLAQTQQYLELFDKELIVREEELGRQLRIVHSLRTLSRTNLKALGDLRLVNGEEGGEDE